MAWTIDQSQSAVEFAVQHLFVSTVRGTFTAFDIDVHLSVDEPSQSRVSAVIQTASLKTDNAERDAKMHSPDFLDVEPYPTMTFVSTDIAPIGPNDFWLRGRLTIHGVTRDVVLNGRLHQTVTDGGLSAANFTVRADIDRRDFFDIPVGAGGVFVGTRVLITIRARLVDTPEQTGPEEVQNDDVGRQPATRTDTNKGDGQ